MSFNITATLKAVDEASATFQKVGDSAAESFSKAAESSQKAGVSFSDAAIKVSNLANAGFNLYNIYDRVSDSQLRAEKASANEEKARLSAEAAVDKFNKTLEKFGEDSDEAARASDELALANEKYRLAGEQAAEMQSRVNEAMVQGAIQAVPGIIGAYGGLNEMMGDKGLAGTFATAIPKMQGLTSGFFSFMMAHPIILVIMAIVAAVILLWKAWETNFGGIRDITASAFNSLKGIFESFLGFGGQVIGFFKGMGDVVYGALKGTLNFAIDIVNIAIGAFNLLIKAYNATIGLIPGVSKLGEIPKIPKLATGAIVTEPTIALIGEAGPEAVIPLGRSIGGGVTINGPLINIEGSADERTIRRAVDLMERRLRSVIVEATSASATTKRIRKR